MTETTSSLAEPTCPVLDFAPFDQRIHDDYGNALTQLRAPFATWTIGR
jgi:hypothetical protein